MNRLTKILAVVLLLALCVSTLGIFSAFAEEAATTAVEYGSFVRTPDTAITITGDTDWKNVSSNPNISQQKDKNEKVYYKLAVDGEDPGYGDYLSGMNFGGNTPKDSDIRINDFEKTVTNDDGSTTTTEYKKNTDYLVVDFDISTDTTYIDGFYFHTAFIDKDFSTTGGSGRYQPKSLYFSLNGEDNESFWIGRYREEEKTGTEPDIAFAYAPYAEDVWQHVTFVYDFTDITAVKVHFYINGIYSGSSPEANLSSAYYFYFIRPSTLKQSINNASTNLANFSIKKFEKGYEGPFTGDRALAHRGTTLDQLPDLAYCLEDAPVTEKTKLADVEKADGTSFTAYNVSDLDANLENGDVVTLYKGISRSLLVPDGATITFKDENGTTLTPGAYAEGDLVNLSALTPLDFTANTVVERDRNTYAFIKAGTDLSDVIENDGSCVYTLLANVTDSLVKEGGAVTKTCSGLASAYEYVVDGEAVKYDKTSKKYSFKVSCSSVLDLNGHTATLSTTSKNRAFESSSKYKIMDGNLIWNGGGDDFTMTNSVALMVFDDVNLTHNAGTFVDGRGGIVMFNDSTVTRNPYLYDETKKQYTNGAIVSEKSTSDTTMSVIVDGTSMDFTKNLEVPEGYTLNAEYAFYMNNVSTGGSRYGGSRNYLVIRDGSDVKMAGAALVYGYAYTATAGDMATEKVYDEAAGKYIHKLTSFTPSEATIANKNENYIDIVDSTIESNYSIVSTNASFSASRNTKNVTGTITVTAPDAETGEEVEVTKEVTYAAQSFTVKAEKFDYDVDVDIKGSTIKTAGYVVSASRGKLTGGAANLTENYDYDVNVSVDGASKIVNTSSVVYRNALEDIDMAIALADGAKLANDDVLRSNDNGEGVTVTLGAGKSVMANTGIGEDYNYVVASEGYSTYTYAVQYKNAVISTPVTFYWMGDAETDPVDMAKVAAIPAATDEYYYSGWDNDGNAYTIAVNPNFKLSANLTALTDFYLNVYLPATVDADKITMIVDGNEVKNFQTVNISGVDYLKAEDQVIHGITPEKIDDTYTVGVSFVGGFGETVELEAEVSAAAHLVKALDGENEEGVAFAQAIINYVVAACEFDGEVTTSLNDYAQAIVAPVYTDAKLDLPDGVTAALNLGDSVRWVFTAEANAKYTFKYADQERVFQADGNGKITIGMKAVNLLGDIVIVDEAGNEGTVNLAGYRAELAEAGLEKAVKVVDAMYYYSVAASAYAD